MNCMYLWGKFNCKNSLKRIFYFLSNCKQNLMHFFMTLENVILIFFIDLKAKLSKHNKKEIESVHYIKIYEKGILKNGFLYVEMSDTIDSPERL